MVKADFYKRALFTIILILLLSGSLFAGVTVDVMPPVAEGESPETVEMITEAITAGLEQAGAGLGKGDNQLRTWFRRELSFYQVKMELSYNSGKHALQQRYPVGDWSALRAGLTALSRQVVEGKAAAEKVALQRVLDKRNLVVVEGGTFQMGSISGQYDEKPVHSVTVNSFYMSKYEVTQGLYQAVMGTNPSYYKGDELPVERVSWYDAVGFCNKLSALDGLEAVYTINKNITDPNNENSNDKLKWTVSCNINANGYRLPTEAEWEYAARGGNFCRGYTYSGSNSIDNVAWYWKNSGDKILTGEWDLDKLKANNGQTHPVGGKQANELGLYDMSGNVWEWCWDWYGDYSSGSQSDPTGMASGSSRVFRGGSWFSFASSCRSGYRDYYDPSCGVIGIGFRLVRRP